jgi:excisionase family DNA binding protein
MGTENAAMEPVRLLSTGQAASLLGSSRQHVVDLCESGQLAYVRVGKHRRIERDTIDAFLRVPGFRPRLRREQLASLWLHRAVAGRLVQDPSTVLDRARANLDQLSREHPSATTWLEAWRRTMDGGPEAVLQVLASPAESAVDLRQNSPFAGILGEAERSRVLQAFRGYWAGRAGR